MKQLAALQLVPLLLPAVGVGCGSERGSWPPDDEPPLAPCVAYCQALAETPSCSPREPDLDNHRCHSRCEVFVLEENEGCAEEYGRLLDCLARFAEFTCEEGVPTPSPDCESETVDVAGCQGGGAVRVHPD